MSVGDFEINLDFEVGLYSKLSLAALPQVFFLFSSPLFSSLLMAQTCPAGPFCTGPVHLS